jgi:Anti-sigma-D factor RsdA to sigma factor binding region
MSEQFHPPFDQPDPAAVARTERFIDALAKSEPVDIGDRALAGLLEDWRDELRAPASSALCPDAEAVAALNRGLAEQRRSRRRMALVGTVAATVLLMSGFGAMTVEAQPGSTLYGIHTKLFGEPPAVHDDRIAMSAKNDLDLVQQMITQGQWEQAQDKLAAVSDRVQAVNDNDRKQDLIDQVNQLNVKVANRDPNATAPPSSLPGAAPAVSLTATPTVRPPGGSGITNQQPNPIGG